MNVGKMGAIAATQRISPQLRQLSIDLPEGSPKTKIVAHTEDGVTQLLIVPTRVRISNKTITNYVNRQKERQMNVSRPTTPNQPIPSPTMPPSIKKEYHEAKKRHQEAQGAAEPRVLSSTLQDLMRREEIFKQKQTY